MAKKKELGEAVSESATGIWEKTKELISRSKAKKLIKDDEEYEDEEDEEEKQEIPDAVDAKYVEIDGKFYHRNNTDQQAFKDSGDKIKIAEMNASVVSDMIAIAAARDWKELKVTGTKDFRRAAWVEAMGAGINATGYKPTEADLAAVKHRRDVVGQTSWDDETGAIEKGEVGAIERVDTLQNKDSNQPVQPVEGIDINDDGAMKSAEINRDTSREDMAANHSAAADHAGEVLVKSGRAPYKHDAGENENFYAVLRDDKGVEREVWGKGIEQALSESGAKPGSRINLERVGKKEVEVKIPVKDEAGNVTGTEKKTVQRADWKARIVSGEKIDEKKAFEETDSESVKNYALNTAVLKSIEPKIAASHGKEAATTAIATARESLRSRLESGEKLGVSKAVRDVADSEQKAAKATRGPSR